MCSQPVFPQYRWRIATSRSFPGALCSSLASLRICKKLGPGTVQLGLNWFVRWAPVCGWFLRNYSPSRPTLLSDPRFPVRRQRLEGKRPWRCDLILVHRIPIIYIHHLKSHPSWTKTIVRRACEMSGAGKVSVPRTISDEHSPIKPSKFWCFGAIVHSVLSCYDAQLFMYERNMWELHKKSA